MPLHAAQKVFCEKQEAQHIYSHAHRKPGSYHARYLFKLTLLAEIEIALRVEVANRTTGLVRWFPLG
jgi:hypothetical protein